MTFRLPPLNALRAFEAAARHLSFKNAAQELSVTPTAVSHQIKLLEDFLDVPLFNRLTRALELTPQGAAMLPKVREGLACFAAAVESARKQVNTGRLVVVVPTSFATRWLVPRLRSFALAHPSINLHVIRSNKTIGDAQSTSLASFDDEVQLHSEDTLVVIRFGQGDYPGFQVDRMFGSDYIAVCSPKLLSGKLPLRVPDDMRHQVLLHDETITSMQSGSAWDAWFKLAGVKGADNHAGPHFSDSGMVYVAALDGLGVALASKPLVANAIAQGRLVAPFDIVVSQSFAYFLLVPDVWVNRPAVQAFRVWLLQEARAQAPQPLG
jgi:LysR family glycine cleavage system transcriptional activator